MELELFLCIPWIYSLKVLFYHYIFIYGLGNGYGKVRVRARGRGGAKVSGTSIYRSQNEPNYLPVHKIIQLCKLITNNCFFLLPQKNPRAKYLFTDAVPNRYCSYLSLLRIISLAH